MTDIRDVDRLVEDGWGAYRTAVRALTSALRQRIAYHVHERYPEATGLLVAADWNEDMDVSVAIIDLLGIEPSPGDIDRLNDGALWEDVDHLKSLEGPEEWADLGHVEVDLFAVSLIE